MSRRRWVAAGALLTLCLAGAGALAAVESFDLPEFVTADEQVPAKEPPEDRRVAVLKVDLESQGDKVQGRVTSQQVINSFAPKSIARNSGDWEVRITGKTPLSYRVPNPFADLEIENPDDPRKPFSAVPTESLEWNLVVPLYKGGEDLGAETIEVVDTRTGERIFTVEVEDRRSESREGDTRPE